MVRGKIQIKKVEDTISRQVTFSKRRNELFKKAYELSVLCDVQVAETILSQNGRLFEFSSTGNKTILERYRKYTKDAQATGIDEEEYLQMQQMKYDTASMAKKIQNLEHYQRRLMGYGLSSCTYAELRTLENKLETSLLSIKLRKFQLYEEHLEELKAKDRNMMEENARLSQMIQCGEKHKEVETELLIELPHQRCP